MENASKALIMAGGILIGIIILSIFVYEIISVSNTGKVYEEEMAKTQVTEFNSQFEIYLNRELKPQEIVTIYNLIQDWNEKELSNIVTIEWENNILKNFFRTHTPEEFLLEYSEEKYSFRCTKLEYGNEGGKISKVSISMKQKS